MKLMTDGRKALLAGLALAACLGFTLNAQAQTCTVANWTTANNLSDTDTGSPLDGNRRYGGPCALRVDIDNTVRSVLTDTPAAETTYIARFYAFLDNAGSGAIQLFGADDGSTDQIQVWYNSPSAGDLTLRVFDTGAGSNDLTFSGVGTGWHSIELVWAQGASADIRFSVDGATDVNQSIDTSGITIENAELGNLNGANTGGTIDFDDFDSRRVERPGRLCRGDTDGNESIGFADLNAVGNEVISGGTVIAAGQPDYDENGAVGFSDLNSVFFNHVQIGDSNCVF